MHCVVCTAPVTKSSLGKCKPCYDKDRYPTQKIKKCAHAKIFYAKNRQRYLKNSATRARTHEYRFKASFALARMRNVPHTLIFKDYKALVVKGCHYCMRTLDCFTGACLDRIDNQKGYTLSNVLPCCPECNAIRSDILTTEETEIVINALHEFRRNL